MKNNDPFQSPEDFEKEMAPIFARLKARTLKKIRKLEDKRRKFLLRKNKRHAIL